MAPKILRSEELMWKFDLGCRAGSRVSCTEEEATEEEAATLRWPKLPLLRPLEATAALRRRWTWHAGFSASAAICEIGASSTSNVSGASCALGVAQCIKWMGEWVAPWGPSHTNVSFIELHELHERCIFILSQYIQTVLARLLCGHIF